MVQYNSVLHSSSFENEERIESLTETISSLQKKLQDAQKKLVQLPALEEELRTVYLQVNTLEKQNAELVNSNFNLNSSIKEQQSWKEEYDNLFIQHQKLIDDQSNSTKLNEQSNTEKFNELHQRIKDQRDIMQNFRNEKEQLESSLRDQIKFQQEEIVS